ncbi:AAA family ATPase [Streptomyces chattanoogensis]|uniref:AAA family ATPase n=1 Tax=Streptomyces chattanoogensis TaxID=66876 RepID=UPI0036C1E377
MTGSPHTRLVVLRGNSASGKSTLAAALRDRCGGGLAVVSQDLIRRTVLREPDVPGAANISLIGVVARHALDHGFDVVVEGILTASRYGAMLTGLAADHAGATFFFYADVPFEETVRRHATRAQAREFGAEELRSWYRERDLLPGGVEEVIGEAESLAASTELVLTRTGLGDRGAGRP